MPAKKVENIYVRLVANHQLELFEDPAGNVPLDDTKPLRVKGDGNGVLQFNFILNRNPGHHNGNIETADLILVPHILTTQEAGVAKKKKDSPFDPQADRAIVLKDPGEGVDPGNLHGGVPAQGTLPDQFIPLPKTAKIRKVSAETGVFKYTIIAVSDDGADFDFVDPTIIIEP